ncbi:LLM class flavin-dependent oxidoreductase [Streptomyces cadmiisoli]|uniref:LLM class flavin-dependent oxidoreductase n=1 Tax=Streptomyces cadmiisoli TaxID=2184053 RepID=UPI003669A014
MKIGVGLPNQTRDIAPRLIPQWARSAEEAGFSTLASVGRLAFPGVMDTVSLAVAAGVTSRIGLISTILIAPVWPPVLLAKELAGIDGVSGGRLTLGVGLGGSPDDFVVEGIGRQGAGDRLDHDLEIYRRVWRGDPVGGGVNPAVPAGTREIPVLFGGAVTATFRRVALSGDGYIGASMPAMMVEPMFTRVKSAWRDAGRPGSPRLVALAYYAITDPEKGRSNILDFSSAAGQDQAQALAAGVRPGRDAVRAAVREFEDIGTDELIFIPALDNLEELTQLAECVL